MPNSPKTTIGFNNQNVQTSTPSIGISHVLARTTGGPFNDPSQVIRNVSQFRSIFGSEIVPDGSISNIETALTLGSMLRICRVPGTGISKAVALSAVYDANGIITTDNGEVITDDIGDSFSVVFTFGDSKLTAPVNKTQLALKIAIRSKQYTSYPNKLVKVKVASNGYLNVELYGNIYRYVDVNATNLIETIPVFQCKTTLSGTDQKITDSDFTKLTALLNNTASDNLEFVVVEANVITTVDTVVTPTALGSVTSILAYVNKNKDRFKNGLILIGYGNETTAGPVYTDGLVYLMEGGSMGVAPVAANWVASLEYLRDYTDAYQLACSHLNQHLAESDVKTVHTAMATFVNEVQEVVYYIDVPKYNTTGTAMTYTELIAWVKATIEVIGYSKFVAYFAGGYKYYNPEGILKDCDNLGTVLGLGDTCASSFGPWFHFSGLNRGLVQNSVGPVSPNYGSPSNYSKLNDIANAYINMSVIKDTRTYGKRTMLFHNFSSQLKDTSEKFLGIVRLNLYLKKTLRPILDEQLEEPNTFSTWNKLYYIVKPKLDKLLGTAMTEYNWYGDQFVTAYKDLEINTEAEVRMGKYKVQLHYKDIVAMQDCILDITIDAASNSVTIS